MASSQHGCGLGGNKTGVPLSADLIELRDGNQVGPLSRCHGVG